MYPSHSFPSLVKNDALPFVIENERQVAETRKAVDVIAERNAVLRLVATCELIEASMNVTEQPAMHARLRSDLEGLKRYLEASA